MNVIQPPHPVLDKRGEPHVRRFEEQRWLIDNIIRANGIDWDQPRSLYLSGPCGNEANADFAGIRERVKKMADIGPAFEAVARRREAKAQAAEEAGHKVTARDNYFMAAVHWGAAQWPYDQNNETNIAYNNKKRECYAKYAALADHHIVPVWVPFKDKAIPAWFHLPPGYKGGRIPVVINVPGMDSFKEIQVALYGDRFLNRGMAVLAIDGPGQYEAPMVGVYFSRGELDGGRQAAGRLAGQPSRGRSRAHRLLRHELRHLLRHHPHRVRAAHPRLRRHVGVPRARLPHDFPGGVADLQEAVHVHVGHHRRGRVRPLPPDHHLGRPRRQDPGALSGASPASARSSARSSIPSGWSRRCKGPKRMVVYQESRHSVGNVPAANLGPFPPILVADWMADRLAGKPFPNEHWFVRSNGQIDKTPM